MSINNRYTDGMTVERKLVMLTVIVPITVGKLSVEMEYGVTIFKNDETGKPSAEFDWQDVGETVYDGMEISEWRKFIKHHKDMGIDYDTKIQNMAEIILNRNILQLIEDSNF